MVLTTNGGTIDGCAGIYEDKGEADGIAKELMRLGHDCLVETRALNTVLVRVSGDNIAPVRTVSESDVIDAFNGQAIRPGRTVAEAVGAAEKALQGQSEAGTTEINVSVDDCGRPIIETTGSVAELTAEFARGATLDTPSKIKDGNGRKKSKFEANLTGQIGELAGQIFLHGPVEGLSRYINERTVRNADKYRGDGGVDAMIGSSRIDFKTTLRRSRKAAPERFNLVVRPHERNGDTNYVLILADKIGYDHFVATIVGVCHESDLPDTTESAGTFRGAYTVPVPRLSAPSNLLEATA
ncbi:hypothetical protein LF599_07340 [Pseudodesulfovibrio thermohalotolerans]|uniref:hypothetical protein n=1 Tax=Pseudodesulfovibrio thermohalotolerans TaxID=2880651 RepID=UPI0022B9F2BF|nr:hypothetical protein [Pseudodesulfovibrio thermohalotolerans]WFS63968.1 hypothetical protein LF599_07340 [Pseudodesulfovibrio thermohalotolerans]